MIIKLSYTTTEAATALGLSRSSIYRLMKTGELKSFRVGRSRLISARELEALIDREPQIA